MLFGGGDHNHPAGGVDLFGHLKSAFDRMTEKGAEHLDDILVCVVVVVKQYDVVWWLTALFVLPIRLRRLLRGDLDYCDCIFTHVTSSASEYPFDCTFALETVTAPL